MIHAYPRGLRGPALQDVGLVLAWLMALFLVDLAPLRVALLLSIPMVLGWGIVTLHFPSRVDIRDTGVSFHHYGRVHAFAWKDVARVRVRRFAVRDRVLVRIEPTGAFRGRYWLVDSIQGFDALVKGLEARASAQAFSRAGARPGLRGRAPPTT